MIGNPQAVEYIKALPKRERVPFERLCQRRERRSTCSIRCSSSTRASGSARRRRCSTVPAALHNVNDEPDSETFSFPFEKKDVSENELRGLIWEQLRRFHPEAGPRPRSS